MHPTGKLMLYGNLLITIGLFLVLLGLTINYAPSLINWLGKLPGDLRIEDDNKSLFIPITSSIVISIILTIIANLLLRK
jgi:hypothetical protein